MGYGGTILIPRSQHGEEHHDMEAYLGSGCITSRILDLGTRRRLVISFTPRSFYPQGNSPWYPLDRRLDGPQSRSGHVVKTEIPSSFRDSNPRSYSPWTSAIPLSYPGSKGNLCLTHFSNFHMKQRLSICIHNINRKKLSICFN
jgi:hypothetical protein